MVRLIIAGNGARGPGGAPGPSGWSSSSWVPRRSCCHWVMSGQPSQPASSSSSPVSRCAAVAARVCITGGHVVRLGRVAGRLLASCRAGGAALAGWLAGRGPVRRASGLRPWVRSLKARTRRCCRVPGSPPRRSATASVSMCALDASASSVASSRPAMEALPVSSRRISTRCRVARACSLRALTPSGLSLSSRAAALRDSWSYRRRAPAARISRRGRRRRRAGSSSGRDRVGPVGADPPGRHPGQRLREAGR